MFGRKQKQSAGDNSNQIQAGQIVVVNGVDEKRVREICQEFKVYTLKEIAQTASKTADARIERLETKLVPRITKIEGGISALQDPEFFTLLKRIQLSAAETNREADYDMLSELLCHRIKNKDNLMNKAAINKAVSIVNQIDEQALLALTVFYFVEKFYPNSGMMTEGLKALENTFSKILYSDFPMGDEWIDHLELLGAVRSNSFGRLKKLSDYYAERMEGYWCGAIKIDSEEYSQVLEMLQKNNLPQNLLVTHELDSEYVRIPVVHNNEIAKLQFTQFVPQIGFLNIPFTKAQIECTQSIYELSMKDEESKQKRKEKFGEEMQMYPCLKKVIDWWNQINVSVTITAAGRVLAHANAQRCAPEIPALE